MPSTMLKKAGRPTNPPRIPTSRIRSRQSRPPSQPLGTVGRVSDVAELLTPVQRRTLDALRRSGDPLVFEADLVADIRTEMLDALDHFADRLEPDQDIFVT